MNPGLIMANVVISIVDGNGDGNGPSLPDTAGNTPRGSNYSLVRSRENYCRFVGRVERKAEVEDRRGRTAGLVPAGRRLDPGESRRRLALAARLVGSLAGSLVGSSFPCVRRRSGLGR